MASSSSSAVPGSLRTNYARIGHAAQQLFPDILQELTKIREPPQRLSHDVNNNKYLSNNLRSDEWSMINNVVTKGYTNFDISLIYKLIRNLNLVPRPTKGWDYCTAPSPTEVTTGDDIERIRRFRNEKLHKGNAQVTDTELSQFFSEFKDIAGRLEKYLRKRRGEFVDIFVDLETCCMDEKTSDMYIRRLERLKKSDQDCMKRIHAVEKDVDDLKEKSTSKHGQIEGLKKTATEHSNKLDECKRETNKIGEIQTQHIERFENLEQKTESLKLKEEVHGKDIKDLQENQQSQTEGLENTAKQLDKLELKEEVHGKEIKDLQVNQQSHTEELTKKINEQSKQLNESKEERHKLAVTQSKHQGTLQTMGQKQEEHTKEVNEWKEKEQHFKSHTEELTKKINEQSKQLNESKEERHKLAVTQTKHQGTLQTMGQKQEENTKEVKELKEKEQHFKRIHQKTKKWTSSRPSKVYKTKAMEAVIEMLNNNDIVTVIGPHGSGKTTLLNHVAVKMEEQGYALVFAKSARDINQFYNENTYQCFIFDDVCGKRDVKMSLLDDWISFSDDIMLILAEEKVKILVGSRSSVYKHPSFQKSSILRKSPYIIPTFSDGEKHGIALYYMNQQEVERLFAEGHVHKIINFLLCLHYHVKYTSSFDLRSFFSIDVYVVKSELMSLKKEQDQSMFAILMLFVFLNNHLNVELLSINFDYVDISRYISDNVTYFLPKVHHYMYNKRFDDSWNNSNCISEMREMLKILKEMSKKMNLSSKLREIFKNCKNLAMPKSALKKELVSLMTNFLSRTKRNVTCYHEGVICMLEIILSTKRRFEDIVHLFNNEFKLSNKLSQQCIKDLLCRLTDSYVLECQPGKFRYTIINDKLFDILVSFCGEHLSNLILTHIDSKIIRDKCFIRLSSSDDCKDNDCLIMFKEEYKDSYFDRLVYDICNGDFIYALENRQLKNKKLCKLFAKYLSENFDAKDALISFQENGYTSSPLCKAAHEGLTSVVAVMLDFQMDIESADDENATPLIEAVRRGHCDTCHLLVKKGADCNKILSESSNEGCTPLFIAAENGNVEIVQLLLQYNASTDCRNSWVEISLLKIPVVDGLTEIVQLILRNGADPNFADLTTSLIYYAIIHEKKEIVEILLNYNANPNSGDFIYDMDTGIYYLNSTPLMAAVKTRNIQIMQVLLGHEKNPANPNYYTSFGETSLHLAAEKGYLEIVQLLLEHYADPSISTGDGDTACSKAQAACHNDIVNVLSEHVMNDEIPKFAEIPNTEKVSRREQIDEKNTFLSDISVIYGPDVEIEEYS